MATQPPEHRHLPLGETSWPEVAASHPDGHRLLLVPLGSTEQHGPHLPLDTDTRIAVAWADGIAARLSNASVAPALPYGSSGEHQGFAGTLSIGRDALVHVLIELVRSAASTFDAIVLVNGHGGNAQSVEAVVDQLRAEGHRLHSLGARWDGERLGLTIDAHAGRVETSLLLHLAARLVRLDRAEAGPTDDLSSLWSDLVAGGVGAVSNNGVLGDPTGASAAEGELLLDDLVDRAVAELVEHGLGRRRGDC